MYNVVEGMYEYIINIDVFRCNVTIFKAILFFIFALFSIKKLLNFTFLVTILINAILYFIFALFIINKKSTFRVT